MLAKTGLLIVSNPSQVGKILTSIHDRVKTTLYIQLLSALSGPLSFHSNLFTFWPMYSSLICSIYSQAAKDCKEIDVRVLLSALKSSNLNKIQTLKPIDLVIFDKKYNDTEIDSFLKAKIANLATECNVITLNNAQPMELIEPVCNKNVYKHCVLGGTFDRLHIAHKILLSEAALRSTSKITVGVTEENMLTGKTLWELTEPLEVRMEGVKDFLLDTCPELDISVVPITDPFGPTQDDPDMNLLVVSAESAKGGQMVNEVRKAKGLPLLEILEVELISEPSPNPTEEDKISSSTTRMRLLGTVIKNVEDNPLIPKRPYVIGLTGGIASGKSGITARLKELGAEIIDCDKVAHELYKPGQQCFNLVVDTFGKSIVAENGEINRKALGSIVFQSPDEMQKLNNILWPSIAEEVNKRVRNSSSKVVVVEAAILLKAGWSKYCHEVWTSIIPQNVAIERLVSRNGLSEEQARDRIKSQDGNQVYVQSSNVIFCSLWSREYTYEQVDKAWELLQSRLH